MSWASAHIIALRSGAEVLFRATGIGTRPKIKKGQLVHVVPVTADTLLQENDVVLCRVMAKEYLNKIGEITTAYVKSIPMSRYKIVRENNQLIGWIFRPAVFGKVISIKE